MSDAFQQIATGILLQIGPSYDRDSGLYDEYDHFHFRQTVIWHVVNDETLFSKTMISVKG